MLTGNIYGIENIPKPVQNCSRRNCCRSRAEILFYLYFESFLTRLPRTSKAHSLVYMSVPKPDLFTAALSNHFSPSTTFLGLVAAPTHFITNRPVTLFFDD